MEPLALDSESQENSEQLAIKIIFSEFSPKMHDLNLKLLLIQLIFANNKSGAK